MRGEAHTIRPLAVRLHRWAGLAIAVFVTIAGLTGSFLAYKEPIQRWLSPDLYNAPGRGAVLSLERLIAVVEQSDGHAMVSFAQIPSRAGQGVRFDVTPRPGMSIDYSTVFLDPVTGQILGRYATDRFPPTRHNLVDFLYDLHEALALPGRAGYTIMGIAALVWFIDCFIGAYLTFPRGKPFARKWKPAWLLKYRRLNYDLHRAGGLWLWVLLAAVSLSAVNMNLNSQLRAVLGAVIPLSSEPQGHETPAHRPSLSYSKAVELASADAARKGWPMRASYVAHRADLGQYQVYFDWLQKQLAKPGGYAIFIDDRSGVEAYVRSPERAGVTAGDRFLMWIDALHMGGVFGWPYRILLCLLGAVIATLSVSGVIIFTRKRRHRRAVSTEGPHFSLNWHGRSSRALPGPSRPSSDSR